MDKEDLRRELKQRRKTVEDRFLKDEVIIGHLENFLERNKAEIIAFYNPIFTEIDLRPFIRKLQKQSKIILLPKIINNEMTYVPFLDEVHLKKGGFGILEPTTEVYTGNIDLIIVPGLGFNKEKHRIGYGKGYYDEYLKKYESRQKMTIGCFYSELEVEFQAEKHDVMLKWIVTEKGIF